MCGICTIFFCYMKNEERKKKKIKNKKKCEYMKEKLMECKSVIIILILYCTTIEQLSK